MEQIIHDDIDIYEFLEIGQNASTNEVKRAYYKLSLKYHPDKNGSIEKFNLLRASYEILSNKQLKLEYDNRKHIQQEKPSYNIDLIREYGSSKRRKLEKSKNERTTVSIYDLPIDLISFQQKTYPVEVKIKPKVVMDEMIISEIMSIFGPIVNSTNNGKDDRYHYFITEFKDKSSYDSALSYDYSSAMKWDGTKVRKLASLLRGCTPVTTQNFTNNPHVNSILEKYVKSVSDKSSM